MNATGASPIRYERMGNRKFQALAIALCLVLAGIMVLNTQMGGEAMWFWYGTVFRQGVKLYTDLHTALQPLFVLETSTWLRLFGPKIAVYEIPSFIHAFLLAFSIFCVLKESAWPDWQKAIVLFGTFVFIVIGHSYRFDDYHVLTEVLITFALYLLLLIGKPGQGEDMRRQLRLTAWLGLVCGLSIVTRVTDGAALITSAILTLPFLVRRNRAATVLLALVVAAATVLLTVRLTGDTFSAYLSSSLLRAASSKGGTGSIFAAPYHMFRNTYAALRAQKRMAEGILLILGAGWGIARYRPKLERYILPLQLVLAALMCAIASHDKKREIAKGLYFEFIALFLTFFMYFLLVAVLARYLRHKRGHDSWDPRYILIVLPILEWASYSAGAAAEPVTNYYAPAALILLLIPVLDPFRRSAAWAVPSVLTVMTLLALNGISGKILIPYSWQNYTYGKLFRNRTWYHHPVYGEMYIDRDLLHFSEEVCSDIGSDPGKNHPELLSLPYPYPNYFCATPPWHNYVQTFFDTATRGSVEHLMQELETAPPQWIVYQRQLNIMQGSERLYNHGRPIAQRDLDRMIMQKLATKQWKLVDESSYLFPAWWNKPKDTDWYIIETHP